MSELVKELQSQLAHVQRLCALKDDKINELEWFYKEQKFNLDRLSKLNSVTLGFNKLITLNSPILSPELRLLASTMYLNVDRVIRVNSATWKRTNSHSGQIAAALGGYGAVEKVYQLPARGGHQANVIFANPEARKDGFRAMKDRYGKSAPAMNYSLQPFPKLRHQDKCMQKIFRDLKQEGTILSYSLNNFAVTRHNDFVFPLYTFRVSGTKVTKYEDSACIGAYRDGFTVPIDDSKFVSSEFQQLKEMICEHVQSELHLSHKSRAPALPTLADHLQPSMENQNISSEHFNSRESVRAPSGQSMHDGEFEMSAAERDIQWPKPGQNPTSVASSSASEASRGSSPFVEKVVAKKTQVLQSSNISLNEISDKETRENDTPSRSLSEAIKDFNFSPVGFALLGQPLAKGPLNDSIIGSPPISCEFTELQSINPNLNISGVSI